MLIQKELLIQLKAFGINSYESKLWTALLAKGSASAGELSDLANVPRSRAYDVLESLEKKGFILMKIGKPIKYIALSPEIVIEKVKRKIVNDAEERKNTLNSLKDSDTISQLSLLYKNGIDTVEPFELSGSIKGRKNIYEHIDHLIKNSSKTITITTSRQGILRKKDALFKSLKKAKERGVKIKVSAPIESMNQDEKKEISQLKLLCELKNTETNARFCIFDSTTLIFMLNDDATNQAYDSAIWITTPFLASAFEKTFDKQKSNL
ncbi:hypothetical protein HYU11_05220 [Candidatus Woesearchaeota archaeon]|nr:hypothetical protein [Candidatus Woesearchaeota archaeon]